MNFLWNPLEWLSDSGALGVMEQAVRGLSFSLSSIIYKLIINLYNLFEDLCTARLLDGTLINEISKRIGLILGLVMFFNIVFSFVKMFISPDTISDKEKGAASIVKKALIVIVLLGCSNFAFDTLYKIQRIIVEEHIISNLILPYQISDDTIDNFGAVLSEEVMYSFYQLENISTEDVSNEDSDKIAACKSLVNAFRNQIIYRNRFDLGYNCLTETAVVNVTDSEQQEIFIVDYNWLLAPAAGIFIVYMLLMYCFKIGVRMIQLMVLEVISPMAIVSYLSPKKDTMYSKWGKIYFATYIDVFIRIAIINFIVFLIATILTVNANEGFVFWESVGNPTDPYTKSFFLVVMILALLTFAKKAPDLIKELLPTSASKLGFGASMKDIVGLQQGVGMVAGAGTAAAIGLIGGVAGGKGFSRVTGAIGGMFGGAFRGGAAGLKSKGIGKAISTARANQSKANMARAQRILAGGGFLDGLSGSVNDLFGNISGYEKLDAEVSSLNDMKADIEKEDNVRDAETTLDLEYQEYYKNARAAHAAGTGAAPLSKTDWRNSIGNSYDAEVKRQKDIAYRHLFSTNEGFRTKVEMHNKRFGTRFGASSLWGRDINDKFRKPKLAELEKLKVRKKTK